MRESSEQLKSVGEALNTAARHGLRAEVVWSAMRHYEKYHKTAPETYSIEWALDCALNDWDCQGDCCEKQAEELRERLVFFEDTKEN